MKGLQVKDNGGFMDINLTLRPLPELQTGCRGMMMVIFETVSNVQKTEGKPELPNQK
jgi:hypothetical protein